MISNVFSFAQARIQDYLELSKARLVSLVLLSTAVGFFLASPERADWGALLSCLLGTSFVAAGSMSLNQWMEREEDARMVRTQARPLPAGRMNPLEALVFGIVCSLAGLALLYFANNFETSLLAAITLASYVFIYTPLKRKTSLCTIVGAIPGAIPPMIGWAAAAGHCSYGAWVLFAIIFFWQMPHFLAIAWLCRNDYAAAGFKMLSVEDPEGRFVGRQIVLYSCSLLPVSLVPSAIGLTGTVYFFGALLLGAGLIALSILSYRQIETKARLLFRASILYLALLLTLMFVDKAK